MEDGGSFLTEIDLVRFLDEESLAGFDRSVADRRDWPDLVVLVVAEVVKVNLESELLSKEGGLGGSSSSSTSLSSLS